MFSDNLITSWSFLYAAELCAFTVAIIFFNKNRLYKVVILWAFSNLLTAMSMLAPAVFAETESSPEYNLLNFVMNGSSLIFPYFALATGLSGKFRFRKSLWVFVAALLVMGTSAFLPYGWLPSVLGYSSGAVVVLTTAWVCRENRLWRGLWGQGMLVTGLLICAVLLMWRGAVIYEGRVGTGFQVESAKSVVGLQMLVITSFFLQFGFLSMLVSRELRSRQFVDRRAARLFEISAGSAEEARRLAEVAEERLDMLGLLTHEVRQPINNARAALEYLELEIDSDNPDGWKSKQAISRAQRVLDSITLSISNAILGVSLLETAHPVATRSVNAREVAELAKLDCPQELTPRICINEGDAAVFVEMDPILIRLALRNLLDNALKYSPVNSPILVDILPREDRLGVSFLVTNQVDQSGLLSPDIFKQRVRGPGALGEGFGLGLFLVTKVADAHQGTISFVVNADATVTFDLFILD